MNKAIIIALVALVVIGGGAFIFKDSLFAIGDPTGVKSMGVTIYDTSGSVSTKSWSYNTYQDCTPDMPTAKFVKAGTVVTSNGIPKSSPGAAGGNQYSFSGDIYLTSAGTYGFTTALPRQSQACVQTILDFAKTAGVNLTQVEYINNTVTQVVVQNKILYNCADGFVANTAAECSSHSVTKFIYTNTTVYQCADGTVSASLAVCASHSVVDTLHTNSTIYVCAETGKLAAKPTDCVNPVPVTQGPEESWFATFIAWITKLFRGAP